MLGRFGTLTRNARLYLLSNTMQAVAAGAFGVLYALFLSALGYGTGFIGLVVVVGSIGGGLGIIPAGMLVARLGWRATLLWSDLIGGAAIAIQLLIPTPSVILLTTLGLGASVALFLVVNAPFLAASSTARERTALFGLNNALGFLAAVAGSLLGGFLPGWLARPGGRASGLLAALQPVLVAGSEARTYQLALLITGALALPSFVPVLLMREEHRRGQSPPADALSAPATPSAAVAGLPWHKRAPFWLARGRVLATGVIGRFSAAQALVGFGAGLFFPFANLYFVNFLGASTAFYGGVSAALAVAIALGSLASAPVSERYGKLRTAIVAQICSIPFLLLLGAVPVLWVAALAFLMRGFLMNMPAPPLQAYFMEAVAEDERVTASSAYNVSFQMAGAIGAGVGGWLIAVSGYQSVFFVAAPFYAVSAVLLILWFGLARH